MHKQQGHGYGRKLRRTSIFQFTPLPNKPTLVHSKARQNAAVSEAVDKPDLHDDMRNIFDASIVIHKSIEKAKENPWVSNGTQKAQKM